MEPTMPSATYEIAPGYEVDTAILEVRYPRAYGHWDSAGELWDSLLTVWPEFELANVEPAATVFRTKNAELRVTIDRCHVIVHSPTLDQLEAFPSMVKTFTALVADVLDVRKILRIGLRLQWVHEFEFVEEAANAVLATGLIKAPDRNFNIKGEVVQSEYSIRLGAKKKSVSIWIKAATRQFDFEPFPPYRHAPPIHSSRPIVSVDVDYAALAEVPFGSVDLAEWVRQGTHVVTRDLRAILGKGESPNVDSARPDDND
jgi:hypothetical protein